MSITPTATIRSASSRPYAAALGVSFGSSQDITVDGFWVCDDHMSFEHNPTVTTGVKRLHPGSFAGVLT